MRVSERSPLGQRGSARPVLADEGHDLAGSLAWGIVMDGFRPDRYDLIGAAICLVGVAVIMYAPRVR